MKIYLFGEVIDNAVYVEDLTLYHKLVNSLNGKKIQVSIEEKSLSINDRQYAFYWGVIIGQYCLQNEEFRGWDKRDVHNYFASKFLVDTIRVRRIKTNTYSHLETIRTLKSLNRKEMAGFINSVISLLAEEHQIEVDEKIS